MNNKLIRSGIKTELTGYLLQRTHMHIRCLHCQIKIPGVNANNIIEDGFFKFQGMVFP